MALQPIEDHLQPNSLGPDPLPLIEPIRTFFGFFDEPEGRSSYASISSSSPSTATSDRSTPATTTSDCPTTFFYPSSPSPKSPNPTDPQYSSVRQTPKTLWNREKSTPKKSSRVRKSISNIEKKTKKFKKLRTEHPSRPPPSRPTTAINFDDFLQDPRNDALGLPKSPITEDVKHTLDRLKDSSRPTTAINFDDFLQNPRNDALGLPKSPITEDVKHTLNRLKNSMAELLIEYTPLKVKQEIRSLQEIVDTKRSVKYPQLPRPVIQLSRCEDFPFGTDENYKKGMDTLNCREFQEALNQFRPEGRSLIHSMENDQGSESPRTILTPSPPSKGKIFSNIRASVSSPGHSKSQKTHGNCAAAVVLKMPTPAKVAAVVLEKIDSGNCGNGFISVSCRRMRYDKDGKKPVATSHWKEHRCLHCDKVFNQRSNATAHSRVHTKEKPFQCKLCSRRFSQKSNLKRHSEAVHGKPWLKKDRCGELSSSKEAKRLNCVGAD